MAMPVFPPHIYNCKNSLYRIASQQFITFLGSRKVNATAGGLLDSGTDSYTLCQACTNGIGAGYRTMTESLILFDAKVLHHRVDTSVVEFEAHQVLLLKFFLLAFLRDDLIKRVRHSCLIRLPLHRSG